MPYATLAQLRQYLDQVPVNATMDALLAAILDRASALIDLDVGHGWAIATATTALVFGDGTDYLSIPQPYVAGSVTAVSTTANITLPAYVESSGLLVARTTEGWLFPPAIPSGVGGYGARAGAWLRGVPYTIAASYGYGAAPAALTEACLEIAADLYRFRDAGSIKAAGAADGGLVRGRALPDTARLILNAVKASTRREYIR